MFKDGVDLTLAPRDPSAIWSYSLCRLSALYMIVYHIADQLAFVIRWRVHVIPKLVEDEIECYVLRAMIPSNHLGH
jgi:hypothetical protein